MLSQLHLIGCLFLANSAKITEKRSGKFEKLKIENIHKESMLKIVMPGMDTDLSDMPALENELGMTVFEEADCLEHAFKEENSEPSQSVRMAESSMKARSLPSWSAQQAGTHTALPHWHQFSRGHAPPVPYGNSDYWQHAERAGSQPVEQVRQDRSMHGTWLSRMLSAQSHRASEDCLLPVGFATIYSPPDCGLNEYVLLPAAAFRELTARMQSSEPCRLCAKRGTENSLRRSQAANSNKQHSTASSASFF